MGALRYGRIPARQGGEACDYVSELILSQGRLRTARVNINTLAKSFRNWRNKVQIQANVRRGRELVPSHDGMLYIETSSICNLDCCFCAYGKKSTPKVVMPNEKFIDYVEQAVEMGFRRFHLTPCTGDIFMDPRILDKLEFLERHAGVDSYHFFTNFTIPTTETLERMLALKKLKRMTVSVYGHDEPSFVAITAGDQKLYRRLLRNLETLHGLLDRLPFAVTICIRSTRRARRDRSSDLLQLLERFRRAGIGIRDSRVFNNWGGYVRQEDLRGLEMDISSTESTFKHGACTLLFTGAQVTATGVVNGCSCRDVDNMLKIGDLAEQPLREILSVTNEAYLQLIREQQAGEFRSVCKSCDYYKSIYRTTRVHRKRGNLRSLETFLAEGYVSRSSSVD